MHKQAVHIQSLIQENSRLNIKLLLEIRKQKNHGESSGEITEIEDVVKIFKNVRVIYLKGQRMLDQQKEMECELFEIYNKNLDRFFSTQFHNPVISLSFFCSYFIPFAICVSIKGFTISVLYHLTFSEWIKKENACIKRIQPREG
ncbi:hypothetical protein EO95_08590 [Methanosarcina sp. 1.H.T.1A.1]|nr:hypothetical protein EO95_08590 [Methanosarcina sp. 1.H.T.1A.1]